MAKIPARKQVNKKYTWNAESVFKSPKEWEAALKALIADIPNVKKHEGKLGVSPESLLAGIKAIEELSLRAYTVYMYAQFAYAVDTTDQASAAMVGRAQGMSGQVSAAISFLNPELLYIGWDKLDSWMKGAPELETYRHSFADLFRQQAHVRSAEVEEILGMTADPFSGPSASTSMLVNADFKFAPAKDSKGKKIEITQGNFYSTLLEHPDRKVRQSAFENYHDKHIEFKNTLATNLSSSIAANVFNMRARKFETTLSASLFNNNVPEEVFHNLINTFKKKLPVWHRFFEIKRKALKLKDIQYFDMWAPIARKKVPVSFEKAVDYISDSLAPLGREYVETLRRGCLQERWVDSTVNLGKTNGAFSYGSPQTHPFIMMSYTGDVGSMSTLAHELGHSMHSYLTWKNQPFAYSSYSLFVAEVASNFNQAMMRGCLLKTIKDKNFLIALIEEAVSGNFFRYFFQMPTLARFELETHQRAERGEPLTADSMQNLMADLFSEAFGPKVKIDRPRVGMVWSTFQHLFADYYVYQYATGISGAHALSARILRGEPNAAEDYLGFLKSGSSKYPLDVLKGAGVDLTTPQAVEETFAVMEGYIDRLEELVG
ncbi:MAG: oligoendopeptidase F [Chloroflexi bacterium]|nr:oligoendopeptidase F [Chloroflexi bacterium CFX1]MCK6568329.1 oligoendopeptidase F [Anaerolineales bacterium]MCQ3951995.1 oligoendopeptidase F [Chloroflexota bacterium]MDL1919255.1 oligoendopeptidase F [Chloroflexi bacterium CFX5]NUQ60704.1 oligoendopeptidase F [Anaerolineales bacterium]